jgi:hypothetical protein
VELVGRLSQGYLADVAAAMDAGRAATVVQSMPPAVVAGVGTELARRAEWAVLGGFVAHVSEPALRASVAELTGEQLLRIGFMLEDLGRLDLIGAMLTDAQVDAMLVAAAEHGLWRELDELVANLSAQRGTRFAERLASLPAELTEKFRGAHDAGKLSDAAFAALTTP